MSEKLTVTTPETAFAEALAAFQAEIPHVGKDQSANTGTFSYSYADLTAVTEAAMPLLAKNGLSFTAKPTLSEAGFVLRYALMHTSGHTEGGDYPLPDPSKASSQQIGSALTYARRYCLCAVTGIAPGGDDDDGAKAADARASDPLPRAPRTRGATSRKGPDETNAPDEWSTPLPESVTDPAWIEDFRAKLVRVGKPSEVDELDKEAHLAFAEQRLTVDDARALKTEIDQRRAELKGELAGVAP